jgi:hypothetical protein
MIKIVSGFTIPAGSTVALVNLCNQFNRRGYSCTLFGPDKWHLDKCRSADISEFYPEKGDLIIIHNIMLFSIAELYKIGDKIEQIQKRTWLSPLNDIILKSIPRSRKHAGINLILTCQANDRFPLKGLKYALFDKIHYADFSQVRYHKIAHDHFICPNFSNPLIPSKGKPDKVAGVIGSIRKENKIDRSIVKALEDGMDTVIVYGYLLDPVYYYRTVEPLTKAYPGRIRFAGFMDNKQKIYDSISDVYSAVGKPWSLIQKECRLTNTRYHGPDHDAGESMTDDQIFALWKNQIGF